MSGSVNGPIQCSLRILIVEDDFYSRRIIQRILSPYGECDIAVNGEEAVEAYRASLEEEFSYDLICLDLLLPVMDGWETLKRIREIEEIQGIYADDCVKVIITTATENKKDVLSAFQIGCEGYITKPVTRKKILSKLKGLGIVN